MEEPLTEELLEQLLAAPDPASFTKEHKIKERDLSDYLYQLLCEHNLERADVIREAGLNETYGYQIFMGQRKPTRNKVLQITFAMHLGLLETNRVLKTAGVNELYVKSKRDAIIIFCLDKAYSLQKTNEELFRFGEETIC